MCGRIAPMYKDKISKLQEFTLLFDTAWATYKAHFSELLKVNIVPVVVITLLLAIFPFVGDFEAIFEYLGVLDIARILALTFGISMLVAAVSSLNYIAQIRVLLGEQNITKGTNTESATQDVKIAVEEIAPVSTRSAYEYASKLLFSYIGVLIITALCTFAGLLLLIVPGIVVAVWLSFSSFIVITGKAKGLEALRTSKRYVRGIWLQVFLRFIAAAFLGMLVSSAFAILQNLFNDIFNSNLVLENFINFVYQLIITPYFTVYGYELYKDVVRANEVDVVMEAVEVAPEVSVEGEFTTGETK